MLAATIMPAPLAATILSAALVPDIRVALWARALMIFFHTTSYDRF